MLENHVTAEYAVATNLHKLIGVCEKEEDYVSRETLEDLLDDTEMGHIY